MQKERMGIMKCAGERKHRAIVTYQSPSALFPSSLSTIFRARKKSSVESPSPAPETDACSLRAVLQNDQYWGRFAGCPVNLTPTGVRSPKDSASTCKCVYQRLGMALTVSDVYVHLLQFEFLWRDRIVLNVERGLSSSFFGHKRLLLLICPGRNDDEEEKDKAVRGNRMDPNAHSITETGEIQNVNSDSK